MREKLNNNALEKAKAQIDALLDENWREVCKMRDLAAINSGGEMGKFAHKTAISITQMPKGDSIDIKVNLSCSAALKDETEIVQVDTHPELDITVEDNS